MRHIVHITGLWHHRLKTVKLFLEPICVRFRVAKSPFFGAQFSFHASGFLAASDKLAADEKQYFKKILNGKYEEADIIGS